MPSASSSTLSIADLEAVYDLLANAIDQAGPDGSEKFLVKLALLDAEALGDVERFTANVEAALKNLDDRISDSCPGRPLKPMLPGH